MEHENWKLEQDSFWVAGMTGRPVAQEVRDLVRGCEDMLKLPWPKVEGES